MFINGGRGTGGRTRGQGTGAGRRKPTAQIRGGPATRTSTITDCGSQLGDQRHNAEDRLAGEGAGAGGERQSQPIADGARACGSVLRAADRSSEARGAIWRSGVRTEEPGDGPVTGPEGQSRRPPPRVGRGGHNPQPGEPWCNPEVGRADERTGTWNR